MHFCGMIPSWVGVQVNRKFLQARWCTEPRPGRWWPPGLPTPIQWTPLPEWFTWSPNTYSVNTVNTSSRWWTLTMSVMFTWSPNTCWVNTSSRWWACDSQLVSQHLFSEHRSCHRTMSVLRCFAEFPNFQKSAILRRLFVTSEHGIKTQFTQRFLKYQVTKTRWIENMNCKIEQTIYIYIYISLTCVLVCLINSKHFFFQNNIPAMFSHFALLFPSTVSPCSLSV